MSYTKCSFLSIDSNPIDSTFKLQTQSEVVLTNAEKKEFLIANKESASSMYSVEIENVLGFDVVLDLSCDEGVQFYKFEK